MKDKIREVRVLAERELKKKLSMAELDDLKVRLLGKKGELTQILKGMGGLSADERPVIGQLANDAREWIEKEISDAKERLGEAEMEARMAAEKIDVTEPGRRKNIGRRHPMTLAIDEITNLFIGMGFEVAEGPEIETDYYNFMALNIPENHPAKDEQDTFYVEGGMVLRTQTSSVQIRAMEKRKPPIRIVAPGKVFRSDEVDATHSPVFHQLEGLVIDKGVTMGDLKGALMMFASELFGKDTKVRFRPHYFPFTEPSAEMDVGCFVCGGNGCRVCKDSGWVELLGCGMVHPKVLEMSGIDYKVYSGYAFGMGLERIAMAKFGISDMRLLFENDVRFLKQFS